MLVCGPFEVPTFFAFKISIRSAARIIVRSSLYSVFYEYMTQQKPIDTETPIDTLTLRRLEIFSFFLPILAFTPTNFS